MIKRTDIEISRYDYDDGFYIWFYYDPDDGMFKAWVGYKDFKALECVSFIPKETEVYSTLTMESFLDIVNSNIAFYKEALIKHHPVNLDVDLSRVIKSSKRHKKDLKKSDVEIVRHDDSRGYQVYAFSNPERDCYDGFLGHRSYLALEYMPDNSKDIVGYTTISMEGYLENIKDWMPDNKADYKEKYFD